MFSVDELVAEAPPDSTPAPRPQSSGGGPLDAVFATLATLKGACVQGDGRVTHPCLFHRDRHPSAVLFADGRYLCSVCIPKPLALRAWIARTEARAVLGDVLVNGIRQSVTPRPYDWPPLEPLPYALAPVPSWSNRLLPASLRPWVSDVTERMGCPPEFIAVGVLVALGVVLGRRCAIRPRAHDDFTVIAHPWGAIVGPPSELKTPALHEAMKPLRHLEALAREVHERELANFAFEAAVAEAERAKAQADLKKAVNAGEDPSGLRDQLIGAELKAPTLARLMVNDATVEKLGELLAVNTNGLLQFRDEVVGWLRTLDREGHESDRAFFLEAWSGLGSFTCDRIGRGTRFIPVCCMTVLGGIQPGPLRGYLKAAIRDGAGADGLVQRFQLLVYPDPPLNSCGVDRPPNTGAASQVLRLFEAVANLDAMDLGADTVNGGVPFLRFAVDAQPVFDGWFAEHTLRLRTTDEHPAFIAHLAKYRSLVPALALLFHVADVVCGAAHDGKVSKSALDLALRWVALLEAHARRIYGCALDQGGGAARLLARKIANGTLPDTFTARDVYRHGWVGLTDPDDVQAALNFLEDHHWVCSEREDTGGRPRSRYWINPESRTAKTDRTKDEEASVSSGSSLGEE